MNSITYPAQCACGHLFLEKYQFKRVTDKGFIGFCWCGFCRTKVMVKPCNSLEKIKQIAEQMPDSPEKEQGLQAYENLKTFEVIADSFDKS